jgi:proline dehydrogenase
VLLVKGAHLESAKVAHRWGEETDVAFLQLAHQLSALEELSSRSGRTIR